MDKGIAKFSELVLRSQKILITSHISPDPDALCSVLLLGTTLKTNFPDKIIKMILEEKPSGDLSFLGGYDQLDFGPVLEATQEFEPGLFVIVDAMNFERVSRSAGAKLRTYVNEELKSVTAIIDHHTDASRDQAAVYLNRRQPATAQELYQLCFKDLSWQKPPGYAETALMGIITDTNRFRYDHQHYHQTFSIVSELIEAGASIEQLENRLERYSLGQLRAFANLAKNTRDSGLGYAYSYIDDDYDMGDSNDLSEFKLACELYASQFLRNIGDCQWGFLVYPELVDGTKTYSVSFRSMSGVMDVAAIAAKLGGGGHKQAAGAKRLSGKTVGEAVETVQAAIAG
ncbi:DHH family phosphoesterase [Candidatus Saccharibacteria bacterium]|nr:DHH family phosphoesterase [Candidatus Saccharibacteria bacterium]